MWAALQFWLAYALIHRWSESLKNPKPPQKTWAEVEWMFDKEMLDLPPAPPPVMIEARHGGPTKMPLPKPKPKIRKKNPQELGQDAWLAGCTPEEMMGLITQHGVKNAAAVAAAEFRDCDKDWKKALREQGIDLMDGLEIPKRRSGPPEDA